MEFPHKDSGRKRLPYNTAVEQAICFDWIDTTVKNYKNNSSVQRFTKRRDGSNFSQTNIERLKRMHKTNQLTKEVQEKYQKLIDQKYKFPADILKKLRLNKVVYKNFKAFSSAYQRIRIDYIDQARENKPEFAKRLNNFIAKTKQGKQFGYNIQDYF